MMNKKSNLFYGWWVVLACFIAMSAVFAPAINGVSIYIKPVTATLKVSRSAFMMYYTIMALVSMLSNPVVGKLMRKYDARFIMTGGVILVSAGYVGFSFSTKLIHFYILAVPMGIGVAASCGIPVAVLITNWFNEKRGLCLGLAMSGSGFGGAIFTTFTVWMITTYSWRTAYLVTGIVILVLAIPFTTLVVRTSPADKGMQSLGEKTVSTSTVGITHNEALKTLSFWSLCLSIVIASIVITGLSVNAAPYLTDIGYSPKNAGNIISMTLVSVLLGKIIGGRLYDKLGIYSTLLIICSAMLLGLVSLKLAGILAFGIIYAILSGFGGTSVSITPSYLTSALFGNKEYSSKYGVVAIFTALGTALAPIVTGAIYNINKSYTALLYTLMVFSIVSYGLFMFAVKTRPKFEEIQNNESANA